MRNQNELEEDEETPRLPEMAKITIGVCSVEVENIKEMRDRRGIDDSELQQEIRGLRIGDVVRLTPCSGSEPFGGETLLVRITSIKGLGFQGQLAKKPASSRLSKLRLGAPVAFTTAHIHSLVKGS